MNNSSAAEWDSAGEMESEEHHAAAIGAGVGMMEVDGDAAAADADDPVDVLTDLDRQSGSLPIDADFFNSFPDDFDDSDLS